MADLNSVETMLEIQLEKKLKNLLLLEMTNFSPMIVDAMTIIRENYASLMVFFAKTVRKAKKYK